MAFKSGGAAEVFGVFLRLGVTCFGGPIAHLGYFRTEFVERRRWLSEGQFAQLLAICQFLPGPASSQLGFSIGLLRAGWRGALCAFFAFTLPSVLLLAGFAAALPWLSGAVGQAVVGGLKILALAVVAHALVGMARTLCAGWWRAALAGMACAAMVAFGAPAVQLGVVAIGAGLGALFCRQAGPAAEAALAVGYGTRGGWGLLGVFLVLLIGLPYLAGPAAGAAGPLDIAAGFYRAGALVFGGGHVVLPLLEETVVAPGWVSEADFVAGYGAAQAVPGPLFAFAAYLGRLIPAAGGGLVGGAVALLAIFLPGFLLVAGVLPLWRFIAGRRSAANAIAGVNAAVVGLLAAAFYDPVFVAAVDSAVDLAIGLVGFGLLAIWRVSPLVVVVWCLGGSLVVSML
ncbi:MAG: chromate efflux transporter [Cellvibrionales bacterium]|nr:chromate efflux transporter [Cellvibrionales bacterium]